MEYYYSDGTYRWDDVDIQLMHGFDVIPSRKFIEHTLKICQENNWGIFELGFTDDMQPISPHHKKIFSCQSTSDLLSIASSESLPDDIRADVLAYMRQEKFERGSQLVQWDSIRSFDWFDGHFATSYWDRIYTWNELEIKAFQEYNLELRPEFVDHAVAHIHAHGIS